VGKIPVALQLYSLRDVIPYDVEGTLASVAKMGYQGVEFAGYYGKSAKELRTILNDNGLLVAGTHIGLETLLGEELEKTVQFNQELGNKFLIVPGLAEERRNSVKAWKDTARIFNELAEKVKPFGMRVGYHNHWDEFKPMDGLLPFDVFFSDTVTEVVMQLDTGNALYGGAESVPLLKKYPGRAATVHLKECSRNEEVNFASMYGEGSVPWKEVFELCETVGRTEWYIVEQEKYLSPPLESVAEGLQALRKLGV